MFFPLKVTSKQELKCPPWSHITYLSSNTVLARDAANYAFFNLQSGQMQPENSKCSPALATYLSSNKLHLILCQLNGEIVIVNVATRKREQTFSSLPIALQEYFKALIEPDNQNEFLGISKLFGGGWKSIRHKFGDLVDLHLDYSNGSLLAFVGNEALIVYQNVWYSYDIHEEGPIQLKGHATFFSENGGFWSSVHYVKDFLLVNHMKANSKDFKNVPIFEECTERAIIKASLSGILLAVAVNSKVLVILQGQKLKATEYACQKIVALEITPQNCFILALSDKGQLFMQAANGDKIRLAFDQYLPFNALWPSLSCHPEENSFVMSDGLHVTSISLPQGFDQFTALMDLLLAKASLLSAIDFSPQNLQICLNNEMGYEAILRDYFGLQDHQKALGLYHDILAFFVCTQADKIPTYLRKLLKNLKFVARVIKNDYALIEWMSRAVKITSLFRPCLAFFVKLINAWVKIVASKNLVPGIDLLAALSKWTLCLTEAVNIKATWFRPAFKAIFNLALSQNDAHLMSLLRSNHHDVLPIDEGKNPHPLNCWMAFYQGQYSRAVRMWEKAALSDSQNSIGYLKRIIGLLLQLQCFRELAICVSWIFTNFPNETFHEIVVNSLCTKAGGLHLAFGETQVIKMLLLCGKCTEAAEICRDCGLDKWALVLDKGQKRPFKLTRHMIDSRQPCREELKEICSLFPVEQTYEEMLSYILQKGHQKAEKGGLLNDDNDDADLRRLFTWAFLILERFQLETTCASIIKDLCCLATMLEKRRETAKIHMKMCSLTEEAFSRGVFFDYVTSMQGILLDMESIDAKLWRQQRNDLLTGLILEKPLRNEEELSFFLQILRNCQDHKNVAKIEPFVREVTKVAPNFPRPRKVKAYQEIMEDLLSFVPNVPKSGDKKYFCETSCDFREKCRGQQVKLESFKKGLFRSLKKRRMFEGEFVIEKLPFWCDVFCKDFSKRLDDIYGSRKMSKLEIVLTYHRFRWCQNEESSMIVSNNGKKLDLNFGEILYCFLLHDDDLDPIYETILDEEKAAPIPKPRKCLHNYDQLKENHAQRQYKNSPIISDYPPINGNNLACTQANDYYNKEISLRSLQEEQILSTIEELSSNVELMSSSSVNSLLSEVMKSSRVDTSNELDNFNEESKKFKSEIDLRLENELPESLEITTIIAPEKTVLTTEISAQTPEKLGNSAPEILIKTPDITPVQTPEMSIKMPEILANTPEISTVKAPEKIEKAPEITPEFTPRVIIELEKTKSLLKKEEDMETVESLVGYEPKCQQNKQFKLLTKVDIDSLVSKKTRLRRKRVKAKVPSKPLLNLPPLLRLEKPQKNAQSYPKITYFQGSLYKENDHRVPIKDQYKAGLYDKYLDQNQKNANNFASIQFSIRKELDKNLAAHQGKNLLKIDASTITEGVKKEPLVSASVQTKMEQIHHQSKNVGCQAHCQVGSQDKCLDVQLRDQPDLKSSSIGIQTHEQEEDIEQKVFKIPTIEVSPPPKDDQSSSSEDDDYQEITPDFSFLKKRQIVIKLDHVQSEDDDSPVDNSDSDQDDQTFPREKIPSPEEYPSSRRSEAMDINDEHDDIEDIIKDVEEVAFSRVELPFTSAYMLNHSSTRQMLGHGSVPTLEDIQEVQSQEMSE